jgi:hypothetical protein
MADHDRPRLRAAASTNAGDGRFNQLEWFAQDNWRVRRNFTIDYGVRFYYIGETYMDGQQVSYFDPAVYADASRVVLYEPVCPNNAATCNATTRLARNPLTGETFNNTFIGKPIPNVGDLYNGMVVGDGSPYSGSLKVGPRVGFGWDVTGDGQTAVRGGAGVFYDRYGDGTILPLVETPPLVLTNSTNFTTLPTLLGSPLVPSTNPNLAAFNTPFDAPVVYNWSIGVQRELPFFMVADVAYVGNANRNLSATIPLNTPAYGVTRTDLNPANADPTNGGQPKATDFLRPFVGYQNINQQVWLGRADYHAIQISVTRPLRKGLAAGMSYTGSVRRALAAFNPHLAAIGMDNTARNESKAGSRPHNLVLHYNYAVPDLPTSSAILSGLTHGWQVSGVSTFQSGTYGALTYAFTGAPQNDMTGGPGDSRVFLACDPNLPRGERTLERQFKTECVVPPGPSSDPSDIYYLGNGSLDSFLNPGYINHDLTLFKNFRINGGRNLQIRAEFYNLTNNNQFTEVDTAATFNFTTTAPTDANFGRVTGTRAGSARVVQLGVRFTF